MSSARCLRPIQFIARNILKRNISTTSRNDLFWEKDPKSGYGKKIKFNKSLITEGFQDLKHEIGIFKEEMKELWESDPVLMCQLGSEQKLWNFKSPEDLKTWVTTADSDHSEGFSTCSFTINEGHGLFSGVLSTDVPKDGVTKRSGYCAIRTHRARKSFKRDSYWNWTNFTHLVVRCRGDGRNYMLNVYTMGFFDNLWNDVFHYPLYTRGGPYWQVSKIPFSKFFFSSKGRIQDIQQPFDMEKISHFGITASDSINGSFNLEIDYIGLLFDPSQSENFAYEMYKIPRSLAAT